MYLTVVPAVLSRAGRAVASAVVGRLALFDRFAPVAVELDAVDAAVAGRAATKRSSRRAFVIETEKNLFTCRTCMRCWPFFCDTSFTSRCRSRTSCGGSRRRFRRYSAGCLRRTSRWFTRRRCRSSRSRVRRGS